MNELKAIPTVYKGIEFRSRLEAKWAVLFDACGVDWEYEPEGFELPDGTWYLSDFLLHDVYHGGDLWVEVKGKLTQEDLHKVEKFCEPLKEEGIYSNPIIILGAIPNGENGIDLGNKILNRAFDSVISSWEYVSIFWGSYEAFLGIDYKRKIRLFDYFTFRECDEKLTYRAYRRALSAKFEHGETPSTTPIWEEEAQ